MKVLLTGHRLHNTDSSKWWGRKTTGYLPPCIPDEGNDGDESGWGSDDSGGSTGKAVHLAKILETKIAKIAAICYQAIASIYYQSPMALRDVQGKIKKRKPETVSLVALHWYQKLVGINKAL